MMKELQIHYDYTHHTFAVRLLQFTQFTGCFDAKMYLTIPTNCFQFDDITTDRPTALALDCVTIHFTSTVVVTVATTATVVVVVVACSNRLWCLM